MVLRKSLRCWFGSSKQSPWNARPLCTNRMMSDRKGDTLALWGSSMVFRYPWWLGQEYSPKVRALGCSSGSWWFGGSWGGYCGWIMGSKMPSFTMMANEENYKQKTRRKDRLTKANKKKIKISLDRNLVSRPKRDRIQTYAITIPRQRHQKLDARYYNLTKSFTSREISRSFAILQAVYLIVVV